MRNAKNFLKHLYFMLGFVLGFQVGSYAYELGIVKNMWPVAVSEGFASAVTCIICGLLFGIIFIFIIPELGKIFENVSLDLIKEFRKMSFAEALTRMLALIVALIFASLLATPIYKLSFNDTVKTVIVILLYSALIYMSMLVCNNLGSDVETFLKFSINKLKNEKEDSKTSKLSRKKSSVIPKILDTSVIIDGRIYDILTTGFIDGPIIIPAFVVEELQFVSDSSDAAKRNRGRRGLDLVNKMQKELNMEVILTDKDYPDIPEVDAKLIKLAKDMKAKVITNDYNLNKVAEIHGVKVLNTNDLSNTVKTVVLPGEVITIHVLKEGKENNQGVAYLDDGTMIVVEGGKSLIGKTIAATVTSVLQTSAGRMIFVKPEMQ